MRILKYGETRAGYRTQTIGTNLSSENLSNKRKNELKHKFEVQWKKHNKSECNCDDIFPRLW